jgi:hypothetical protein
LILDIPSLIKEVNKQEPVLKVTHKNTTF